MNGNGNSEKVDLFNIHQQSVDNATKIVLVQQSLVTLQGDVSKLANTVTMYIQSDMASKKPNYSLWIAFISLLILMCGGGWAVLNLRINAEVTPMVSRLSSVDSALEILSKESVITRDKLSTILNQNQSSTDDRLTLNKNMDILRDRISTLAAQQAAEHADRTAHETEIETQFNANSQLLNTQFAEQQRVNSTLWQQHGKNLGMYPNGPFFFPNISAKASGAAK